MALALWLALQAAAGPVPRPPIPSDFDLADVPPADAAEGSGPDCGSQDPGEIVVCGRRPRGGDYPLEKMARLFENKPVVAEMGIGGGAKARAYVESYAMPDGTISKRVMVGVKLPF